MVKVLHDLSVPKLMRYDVLIYDSAGGDDMILLPMQDWLIMAFVETPHCRQLKVQVQFMYPCDGGSQREHRQLQNISAMEHHFGLCNVT